MKSYTLGVNTLYPGDRFSVIDQMAMIRRVGFDACFTAWEPGQTEARANAAAKLGLAYASIHSPFLSVDKMWQEGEAGRAVARTLTDCVIDCARFAVPVMVIHPSIGFEVQPPTQAGLDNYARVVETADKLGVTLGFENVEGESEARLAALMRRFWSEPSCGFCFDTGHECCYNGGKDMMAKYGEKLCMTHCNDNFGAPTDPPAAHPTHNDLHLPMGDGVVDWNRVMDRIDASPYEGVLMCELKLVNPPGKHTHDKYLTMPPEDFYALAFDRARGMRARAL